MKKTLLAVVFCLSSTLLMLPKSHESELVTAINKSLPKSVMIESDLEVPKTTVELFGMEIYRSTETVRVTSLGSGVFISSDGYVLTAAHLFGNGEILQISVKDYSGETRLATLVYKEKYRDLAVLKLEGTSPSFAKLADSRLMKVGQEVIAIGNPLGLEFTATHGIISYLNRDIPGSYNTTQSDAFINPGNSGGPLFNLKGELVGINVFIIPPVKANVFTGLGFSVSPDQIHDFLIRVRKHVNGN